jgi:phage host-nuclease inhibitor protein Gam
MKIYTIYADRAREAMETLTKDFDLAIGSGAGALVDVLDSGKTSEDFHLDEYQIELLRAKAVEGYWARRLEIAQAVSRYAEDLTAGRTTDAESVAAWKAAKAQYDQALTDYKTAQDNLTHASGDVTTGRTQLTEAAAALAKADQDLEALNQQYALKMSLLAVGSVDFLKDELTEKYTGLLERYGLLQKSGAEAPSVRYLEKARQYGLGETIERTGLILKSLVQGDYGEPSLAELNKRYSSIQIPPVDKPLPSTLEAFGIDENSSQYGALQTVYEAWKASSGDEKKGYERLLRRVVEQSKGTAEAALKARLDSIALLSAGSWDDWYTSRGGTLPSGCSLTDDNIGSTLARDLEQAERAYLAKRLEKELALLHSFLDPTSPASEEIKTMVGLSTLGATMGTDTATELVERLTRLETTLRDLSGADTEQYRAQLEELAKTDHRIGTFLQGQSSCMTATGIDLVRLLLQDETLALERSRGRRTAYERYAAMAGLGVQAEQNKAWQGVTKGFTDLGITTSLAYGELPSPAVLGTAFLTAQGGPEVALGNFLADFDRALEGSPSWLKHDLDYWKGTLIAYVAAKARYTGSKPAPDTVETLKETVKRAQKSLEGLQKQLQALYAAPADDARLLCALLADGAARYGDVPRETLEQEAVHRIARSLVAKAGDLSALEQSEQYTRLMKDAEDCHGYANDVIRGRAVAEALEGLSVIAALANKTDPAELGGRARTERLYQFYGELDLQGLRSLVTGDLGSLDVARLEPEDITADTINQLLPNLRSYLDRLGPTQGSAAVYEARAISLLVTESLQDHGELLAALLSTLGLERRGTADGLINLVRGPDYTLEREVFAGIGTAQEYYETGVLYYLQRLAYQGRSEQYAKERDLVLNRLRQGGQTELANRIGTKLERFSQLINLGRSYGGMELSGDPMSYAQRQRGLSVEDQFALGRLIASGTLADVFMEYLGNGEGPAEPQDVYNRWLGTYVQGRVEQQQHELSALQGRLAYAEAYYDQAEAEARADTTGGSQWRVYLEEHLFTKGGDGADALQDILWSEAGHPEEDAAKPRSATSWKEGTLADSYEQVALATKNLGASFAAWSEQLAQLGSETSYRDKIRMYLDNPGLAWDEGTIVYLSALVQDGYSTEYSQYHYSLSRLKAEQQEVGRLGAAIAGYKGDESLKAELNSLAAEIAKKQADYQQKAGEYAATAEAFAAKGAVYENLYRIAKTRYERLEEARQTYEQEDAIRRWASTSYLGTDDTVGLNYRGPAAELAYTQERKNRASIALKALQDLYSSTATSRPYKDDTYNALYQEYQASFDRMMLTLKAQDAVQGELAKEYKKNGELYQNYTNNLYAHPISYADYELKTDTKDASWKDLLQIDAEGNLRLNYRSDFTLHTIDAAELAELKNYFETQEKIDQDTMPSTAYERQMRQWAERMAGYNLGNLNTFTNWALARDYLVDQLIKKNYNKDQGTFAALVSELETAEGLQKNIGSMHCRWNYVEDVMKQYRDGPLAQRRKDAYDSLSDQQKKDLEFLLIMNELGDGGTFDIQKACTYASVLLEYQNMDDNFSQWIKDEINEGIGWHLSAMAAFAAAGLFSPWMIPFGIAFEARAIVCFYNADQWQQTKDVEITRQLKTYKDLNNSGAINLNKKIANMKQAYADYQSSSNRIAILEGKKASGESFTWTDLEQALKASGKVSGEELRKLKGYWEASALAGSGEITNVSEALAKLSSWGRSTRDDAKRKLNTRWEDDETVRQAAQQQYRDTLEAYIAGKASKADLDTAARAAYGDDAASQKTHLSNLVSVYEDNLESMLNGSSAFQREYAQLGQELADSIGQTYRARFAAELAAREAEWNEQRRDLQEKQAAWREAAGLILERGRADWKAGAERLRDSYTNWKKSFAEAYSQGSAAWDGAYLEGLREKDAWALRASETATKAASEALLALVGQDAEAGARKFDTLGVVAALSSGAEEAKAGIRDVLSMAGIVNLSTALNASMGSADTTASLVRTGVSGLGLWDSGKAQVAAARFTREANQELASRQARLVAAQAREMAQASIKGLEEQVQKANENFRESMDETFVLKGSWQKEGQNYRKDVVVYSTLLDPVVTEGASVQGYIAYLMQPVSLRTDLSDSRLAQLEYTAIQALLKQAQDEVKAKSDTIFGSEADNSEEAKAKRKVVYEVHKMKTVATDLWTMLTTFKTTKEVVEATNTMKNGKKGPGTLGNI